MTDSRVSFAFLVDVTLAFSGGALLFGPGVAAWMRVLGGIYLFASTLNFKGWRR